MENFEYAAETYIIIGICMEVHKNLGHGFSEVVYKDAVELESAHQVVEVEREKPFTILYKGSILKHKFFADLVFFKKIIVEIKCFSSITEQHICQTLNYMKASGCKIGLIINFGKTRLEYKRLIL